MPFPVAHAELRLVVFDPAGEVVLLQLQDALAVVGMNERSELADLLLHLLGRVSEHSGPPRGVVGLVRDDVPIPHAIVRSPHGEFEPLLAPSQSFFRRRPFANLVSHCEDRHDQRRNQCRRSGQRRQQPWRPANHGSRCLGQPQVAVEGLVVGRGRIRLHLDQAGVDSLREKRRQGTGFRQGKAQLTRVEQDGSPFHGVLCFVLKAEDAVDDARVDLAVVEKPEDGAVVVDLDERARDGESLRQIDDTAWDPRCACFLA